MEDSNYANDNEPSSFVSLAALTANVTRFLKLDEKKNEERDTEKDAGKTADKRADQSAASIERRIEIIVAMQNRLRRKEI